MRLLVCITLTLVILGTVQAGPVDDELTSRRRGKERGGPMPPNSRTKENRPDTGDNKIVDTGPAIGGSVHQCVAMCQPAPLSGRSAANWGPPGLAGLPYTAVEPMTTDGPSYASMLRQGATLTGHCCQQTAEICSNCAARLAEAGLDTCECVGTATYNVYERIAEAERRNPGTILKTCICVPLAVATSPVWVPCVCVMDILARCSITVRRYWWAIQFCLFYTPPDPRN